MSRRGVFRRRVLPAAVGLYRLLLVLHPPAFRRAWGREMAEVFARRSLAAHRQGGRRAVLAWWGRAAADLALAVPREWADRGGDAPAAATTMTTTMTMTMTTGGTMMTGIVQDVVLGVRRFRRAPVWTATAVVTLAVGVGAVTGVFSLVHDALLRPLPFERPEELVTLSHMDVERQRENRVFSWPLFEAFRDAAPAGLRVAGYARTRTVLEYDDGPRFVDAAWITSDLLPVLGVRPLLGRGPSPEEGVEGGPPSVVLGEALWHHRFGGDPGVVGSTLSLGGESYTVVGVVGPELEALAPDAELWFSTALLPRSPFFWVLEAVGRVPPGAAVSQVAERAAAAEIPDFRGAAHSGAVRSLRESVVGDVEPVLLTFLAVVCGLLLIGTVNLANLMLARAIELRPQRDIQVALGAGGGRLARQDVLDGLGLGLAGAAAGLLLAGLVRRLLVAWSPSGIPGVRSAALGVEEAVVAVTLSGVVCVTLSAWSRRGAAAGGSAPGLSAGRRTSMGDRRTRRAQRLLVTGQIAATFVVLVASVLLLRAFLQVGAVDPGLALGEAAGLEASIPADAYPDDASREALARELIEGIQARPGVVRAVRADRLPLRASASGSVEIEGVDAAEDGERKWAATLAVGDGFLETLGIELVRGSDLPGGAAGAAAGGEAVALVSESFVEEHFPARDAVGRTIRVGGGPWRRIVGVVADIRMRGPGQEPGPLMIEPLHQVTDEQPSAYLHLAVRADVPADRILPTIRAVLREVEPRAVVSSLSTFEDWYDAYPALAGPRFRALVVGLLGAAALLMAITGIYGVAAYGVSRRTREIGVRIALGASGQRVVRGVLGEAAATAGGGALLGVLLAWWVVPVLGRLLPDVPASDPATLVGVAVAMAVVAVLASLRPAVRAARVQPTDALRAD